MGVGNNRRKRVLGVVLAGGKGERLMPLTKYRAKPAVHFAAKFRIIDFALSNLVNSGIFSIYVLVQFKSQSLNEHIERGWQFSGALRGRDFFTTLVPAQMWRGEHWFQGTADAVYQNLHLLSLYRADQVCIFAADHIYKMDVSQMMQYHYAKQADVTVAANVVPTSEASQFGCIKTDTSGRITEFLEKPAIPPEIPGNPGFSYVSMGNYVFNRAILEDALVTDAQQPTSHDFGRDIIPSLISQKAHVYAYDFSTNQLPHFEYESEKINHWRVDKPYWRDVGTIKSYWEAHMELLSVNSEMTLYNPLWPIKTVSFADPPSYSYPSEGNPCIVDQVLQAEGSRILGAEVQKSVLSRNCAILPKAKIEESIIGQGVVVGKNCRIKRAIIDSYNIIPEGTIIGEDPEEDAKKYTIDPKTGIAVIGMPKIRYQKDIDDKTLDSFSWSSFS